MKVAQRWLLWAVVSAWAVHHLTPKLEPGCGYLVHHHLEQHDRVLLPVEEWAAGGSMGEAMQEPHEVEPHDLEQHDLEPHALEPAASCQVVGAAATHPEAATLNPASCQVVHQLAWPVEALQTHLAQLVLEALAKVGAELG